MNRYFMVRAAGLAVLVCVALAPRSLGAQQRDTARVRDTVRVRDTSRVAVDTVGPRPELRPPISPRRAFLYSLALPGYSQSILGRTRAGVILVAFEATALVMIGQSASGVREARRNKADSIPVSFVNAEGGASITYRRTPFPSSLVNSRRAQVEDWIAVLVANHLFAAADGYVAALLWDLPQEVSLRATPHSAELAIRLSW